MGDKRRDILDGALAVFARHGYARSSIEAISAAARVSTRTVYNHFRDKADLFRAVVEESASRAAEAQVDIIDGYLRRVTDPEADLIAFGRAWAASAAGHRDHLALVRQISAGNVPRGAIEAWREAGPLRVRERVARHLRRLMAQGVLRVADPELAARHLLVLVTVTDAGFRAGPPAQEPARDQVDAVVTAGVRAFLYGYARG